MKYVLWIGGGILLLIIIMVIVKSTSSPAPATQQPVIQQSNAFTLAQTLANDASGLFSKSPSSGLGQILGNPNSNSFYVGPLGQDLQNPNVPYDATSNPTVD